jgi:glutamate synthase domain-containing protein 2/rubredoxin
MKIYECGVCGNIYDEAVENASFGGLEANWECSVCGAPKRAFSCPDDDMPARRERDRSGGANPLGYPAGLCRAGNGCEAGMERIHRIAVTGETVPGPVCTRPPLPSWDDILFLGAQLDPLPLDADAVVDTETIIGKNAEKPMKIDLPVYVSHMPSGALSQEGKIALARGSASAKTAVCGGGILPEERDNAYQYIFEYVPGLYGVTDENLRAADAIEIKIGQWTRPGMGGRVTEEIAAVRGRPVGEGAVRPSRFPGIRNRDDLGKLVEELRERSGGRPIGVKIAAGRIERDLAVVCYAWPDFITIDGRGGAAGASPRFLKDAASVPAIYALSRARAFLDDHDVDIDLVITGGLRTSADFVKALCMGADAVAVAAGALLDAAYSGKDPAGVMPQDPELRKNLDVDAAVQRVADYFHVTKRELETFARISGHASLDTLGLDDLCSADPQLVAHAGIPPVWGADMSEWSAGSCPGCRGTAPRD